jgi:hypothetical protein
MVVIVGRSDRQLCAMTTIHAFMMDLKLIICKAESAYVQNIAGGLWEV